MRQGIALNTKAVAFALGLWSCAARVTSLDVLPAVLPDEVRTTAVVDALTLTAGPSQKIFALRDASVFFWTKLRVTRAARSVRICWYDPYGRLYLDSGPVSLPGDSAGEAGLWLVVSHRLPVLGAPAGSMPGHWQVVLRVDEVLLAALPFELATAEGQVGSEDGQLP